MTKSYNFFIKFPLWIFNCSESCSKCLDSGIIIWSLWFNETCCFIQGSSSIKKQMQFNAIAKLELKMEEFPYRCALPWCFQVGLIGMRLILKSNRMPNCYKSWWSWSSVERHRKLWMENGECTARTHWSGAWISRENLWPCIERLATQSFLDFQ